jgi:peptidoglycan/xylan/chitin deacetylase (PgdA/CDA1 family)
VTGFLRKTVRRANRLVPKRKGGITILAYHLVGARTGGAVDLPKADFVHQMKSLKNSANVLSLDRALDLLKKDAPPSLDRESVVITFDDAYGNFHQMAWPILKDLGLPTLLYVPVGFVDGKRPGPISTAKNLPACTWEALREMVDEGLAIGSHGVRHENLLRMGVKEALFEIGESKKRLEGELATGVTSFCYPQAKWNPQLEGWVKKVYESAVIGGGKKVLPGHTNPHRLTRTSIRADMPPDLLPILRSSIWLEEYLADRTRRFRP